MLRSSVETEKTQQSRVLAKGSASANDPFQVLCDTHPAVMTAATTVNGIKGEITANRVTIERHESKVRSVYVVSTVGDGS